MSLLGAWVVADSAGKAKTLTVGAPGFEDAEVAAAATYLKSCSGCDTEALNIPDRGLLRRDQDGVKHHRRAGHSARSRGTSSGPRVRI